MKKFCFLVISLSIVTWPSYASKLSFKDSQTVRSWMVRIINEQLRQGPSPKWQQKDCVGLVRYAFLESLKVKNSSWYRSHGFSKRGTPPDLSLDPSLRTPFEKWKQYGEGIGPYISALGLIQENAEFISKHINQAKPGDVLFFDMGDSQHLMVWMGSFIAYHTGTTTKTDNGLRKYHLKTLIDWKDSRWRPISNNPNFIGVFKLASFSY